MKQAIKDYEEIRAAFARVGTEINRGIAIGAWDRAAFERAYRNYSFYLLPHHICGDVLYAAQDADLDQNVDEEPFWETFANLNGEMRHWLHFTTPKLATPEKECDNLCYQEEPSPDKPDQTLGIRWYAYRVPGMVPYLMEEELRRRGERQDR